ncbi:MAG TPA: response regulator [Polaromonas sp.]|uniref:response regulator n=1 Tax=Polaromonas sp. TaxID=1869339 RepID=UPI002D6E41F7|nr:response regulator [Polaromonas sp.]HYW56280.1 response regulator [Polaromonas sp.]
MPLIVVMEDDAATRTLVASVLRKNGYDVLSADNGLSGLELVRNNKPDLVISDVQMPTMDGFAMLQALRADPAIFATPVILLTSLQERAHMRIGMTSGADDYITKPFRPGELREAAAAQLNRRQMQAVVQTMTVEAAVLAALEDQKHHLSKLYEQRLASELSEKWPADNAQSEDEKFTNATVLFVDVINYAGFAEKLSNTDLSDVVRQFYNNAGDTVHLFGARLMQFVGDGLLVIFVDSADTTSVNHGLRAARAALGLSDAAKRVQQFLNTRFPTYKLPRFDVSVALNSGPVALARLEDPLRGDVQVLPVGDTVSATLLLQKAASKSGWRIAASVSMLRGVTGAVNIGGRALISLPGRSAPIDAAELLGLALET